MAIRRDSDSDSTDQTQRPASSNEDAVPTTSDEPRGLGDEHDDDDEFEEEEGEDDADEEEDNEGGNI